MLTELLKLLQLLATKPKLNEDEFALYTASVVYAEMQVRAATVVLKGQLESEGFTDDDLKGYTPAQS